MTNIGCRIYSRINRPDKNLIDQFEGLSVAAIGDSTHRLFCVDSAIRPVNDSPLLGTAFTLHVPSGDNLLFHKALEIAEPGDVIVVASGGPDRSYCGEMMILYAKNKGLAGFAVDGCIRDVAEASELDFPVYARGVAAQGPYKIGAGEMNVPIAFGGQVVFPGDIVVGDQDGLIFVRPHEAKRILKQCRAQHAKEDALRALYRAGVTKPSMDKDTMDTMLGAAGCQIIDACWDPDSQGELAIR